MSCVEKHLSIFSKIVCVRQFLQLTILCKDFERCIHITHRESAPLVRVLGTSSDIVLERGWLAMQDSSMRLDHLPNWIGQILLRGIEIERVCVYICVCITTYLKSVHIHVEVDNALYGWKYT